MIRRVLTRLLRVAPPGWALAALVVCYLLCEGPVWYIQWKFGRVDMRSRVGPRILLAGGLLLGAYRAIAFHPYFRPGYVRWLKGTPWTVSKPLPLGSLELVPEDALALGLLALLGTTLPDFTSLYIINMFLLGNICALILTFWKTGAPVHGYCALLFLGFIPQWWQRQWIDLALLTGIYLIVHEGLWHTLRKFPWQSEGFLSDFGLVNAPAGTDRNPSCGWSFDRFYRDIRMAKGINRIDALLCCMLGSWWVWSVCSLIVDPRERAAAVGVIALAVICFAPSARWLIYIRGYQSPISVWGRVWTFRWIIPGYDQVYVGPICSFMGGVLLFWFLMRIRPIPVDVCWVIAGGAAAFLALTSPPSLRRWRLVGEHRIGRSLSDNKSTFVTAGGP